MSHNLVSATVGDPFSVEGDILPLRMSKRICRMPMMGMRQTFFGIIANANGMWICSGSGQADEIQPEIMRRAAMVASRSGFRGEIVAGLAPGASDREATFRALGGRLASQKCGKASYRVSRDGEVTAFPARALNPFSRIYDGQDSVTRGVMARLAKAFYGKISSDPDLVDLRQDDFDAVGASEPWRGSSGEDVPITRFVGPGGGGKTRLIASLFGLPWQSLPEASGPGLIVENDRSSDVYRFEVTFRPRSEMMVETSALVFETVRAALGSECDKLSVLSPHLSGMMPRKGFSIGPLLGRPSSASMPWSSIVSSLNVALSEASWMRDPHGMIDAAASHVLDLVRDAVIAIPFGSSELTAEGGLVNFRYATKSRSSFLSALRKFAPPRLSSESFYGISGRIRIIGPLVPGVGSFAVADDGACFADRSLVVEKALHAGESSDLAMAASHDGPVFSALTMFDETPDMGHSGHEVRRLRQAWSTIPGGEGALKRYPPFRFGGLFHGALSGILKSDDNAKDAARLFTALCEHPALPRQVRQAMISASDDAWRSSAEVSALTREIRRLRSSLMTGAESRRA